MWIPFALLAGLGDALRDALSKKASASIPRPLITWSYTLCALPFFLPTLARTRPDSLPLWMWWMLLGVASLHVLGGLMLVKALQLSDLSLCIPMIAFTPVFLLVLGPLLAGDVPSIAGIVGAVLVAVGSYVLNIDKAKTGLLAPFRALAYEPGPRIMLGLSLLWTVTACADRVAVQVVDRTFWGSAQLLAISLAMIPVVIARRSFERPLPKGSYISLLSIGGCNALSLAGYLFALQVAPVHHVLCLKRVSILFSVMLGRILFGERFLGERLPGALLMVAGVAIITMFA